MCCLRCTVYSSITESATESGRYKVYVYFVHTIKANITIQCVIHYVWLYTANIIWWTLQCICWTFQELAQVIPDVNTRLQEIPPYEEGQESQKIIYLTQRRLE